MRHRIHISELSEERAWPVPVRLLWRRFAAYARKTGVAAADRIEVYVTDSVARRWPQAAACRKIVFELAKDGSVTWYFSH